MLEVSSDLPSQSLWQKVFQMQLRECLNRMATFVSVGQGGLKAQVPSDSVLMPSMAVGSSISCLLGH